MHGRYVPVHAEIVQIPDFSVHADARRARGVAGPRAANPPHTVYVVHGEPRSAVALARRITEDLRWCAVVPRLGERVRLDR